MRAHVTIRRVLAVLILDGFYRLFLREIVRARIGMEQR